MKFGIANNKTGHVICDPIQYDRSRFADVLQRYGGNAHGLPDELTSFIRCGRLAILPAAEIGSQSPNEYAYHGHLSNWVVVGEQLQRSTEWHLLPDDQIRQNMAEAVAGIRWQKETGGITLANGVTVKTDRESQGTIFNGYSSLKNGLVASSMWKFAGEWAEVTLPDVEPIAQAVSRHVQACFSAEKAVSDLIDNAEDTDALLAIDLQHEFSQAFNND